MEVIRLEEEESHLQALLYCFLLDNELDGSDPLQKTAKTSIKRYVPAKLYLDRDKDSRPLIWPGSSLMMKKPHE